MNSLIITLVGSIWLLKHFAGDYVAFSFCCLLVLWVAFSSGGGAGSSHTRRRFS